MATINRFLGAETGGLEELSSTTGTVTASTANTSILGSDDYHYRVTGSLSNLTYELFNVVSDAGNGYILGFRFETADAIPSATHAIAKVFDGATAILNLFLFSSGNLGIEDANSSTIRTITTPFSDNTSYYIEVYFQHSATGTIEVFIDGVSQGSDASQDLTNGGTLATASHWSIASLNVDYNDIYFMSGATASSDRLGPVEVIAYRSSLASATPDVGSGTLDTGNWADAQEVPFSETNTAAYTAAPAASGAVDTDDVGGSAGTGGPNTDTNVDVANIKALSGIWRMDRTGGSGAAHYGLLGNSGDAIGALEQTADFDPTTAFANYFHVTEVAARIPGASEYLTIGFEKSSGGQDFVCSDMLAQILHVPPAASAAGPILRPPLRPYRHNLTR